VLSELSWVAQRESYLVAHLADYSDNMMDVCSAVNLVVNVVGRSADLTV